MVWFDGGAARFGWLVGNASGLYALIIITLLILLAPPYRRGVPRMGRMGDAALRFSQWGLVLAPVPLVAVWAWGAFRVGRAGLETYAIMLSLGTIAVFAPILLVLMFTAAQWIGRSGAR